jgi:hypothetical protein
VKRALTRGAALAGMLAAAVAGTVAVAGCGSMSSSWSSTPEIGSNSPMATSLASATDSWAVIPMSANPAFWQVFVRPAASATWKLVTPPGVAINGGLVAAVAAGSALTVAVRPSQELLFSPLASTTNAGANWSTGGPINAAVAASPDALAASGGSDLVTLLTDGTIETSANAGSSWTVIAKPGAIASSKAGQTCGSVDVTSVSFGANGTDVLAGGTCGTAGTTAIFSYSGGAWQRVSVPVSGRLLRLSDGVALVQTSAGLEVLFAAAGWAASPPLPDASAATQTGGGASASQASSQSGWGGSGGSATSAALPVTGTTVTASGTLAGGGAWVLLPDGAGATIAGPGQQWLLLPPLNAKITVLAAGPGGSTQALSVSGATLDVWQLAPRATYWTKVQAISVPIQVGSSS